MTIEAHCCRRAAFLLLLLSAVGYTRERKEAEELPDGTTFVVQLEEDVRADCLKPGDEVQAKVIAPAIVNGAVAIPANAKVTAVVLHAEARTSDHPSRLVLRFRHAHWPSTARALNAYVTRQLVRKHNYSLGTRAFCPPGERYVRAQSASDPGQLAEPLSAPDSDQCHAPLGTQRADPQPVVFTSPAMKEIVVRPMQKPNGAAVLEAANQHVTLRKGIMLEVRHSAE